MKRLKQTATSVSVGDKVYFASQVVAVVNNELDLREWGGEGGNVHSRSY